MRAHGKSINFYSSQPICGAILFAVLLIFGNETYAGHSRSGYLDAGQSVDGRFLVTAKRSDARNKKGRIESHVWHFHWRDREGGGTHSGELQGLRTGTDDVFDPVNSHIFVSPDGETFALWTPQAMAPAKAKKPEGERGDEAFQKFAGFSHRLTIYRKTGEVVKRFDTRDFLLDSDWSWLFYYGRQVYWLKEYPGLTTRSAPRSGYALYRISPDYTVLEFQVGATSEASHHAKKRGVTPPAPRTVRVRLTDGTIFTDQELTDPEKIPVQPFQGDLASKERRQFAYVPRLNPVKVAGRFTDRSRDDRPVRKGLSSPQPIQPTTP